MPASGPKHVGQHLSPAQRVKDLEEEVRKLKNRMGEGISYSPQWAMLRGGGYSGGSPGGEFTGDLVPMLRPPPDGFGIQHQTGGFVLDSPRVESGFTWYRGVDYPTSPGTSWMLTASWNMELVVGTDVALDGTGLLPYWCEISTRINGAFSTDAEPYWQEERHLYAPQSPYGIGFSLNWGGHYTAMFHTLDPQDVTPNLVGFVLNRPKFYSQNFTELHPTALRWYDSAPVGNPRGNWDILIAQMGPPAII